MFKEIFNNYRKKALCATLGRSATSIMVIVFIAFMIVMVEYAIPSGDINLIVKLGITYMFVNIFRAIVTLFEEFCDVNMDLCRLSRKNICQITKHETSRYGLSGSRSCTRKYT